MIPSEISKKADDQILCVNFKSGLSLAIDKTFGKDFPDKHTQSDEHADTKEGKKKSSTRT